MRIGHYYPTLLVPSGVTAAIGEWSRTQRELGHDVLLLTDRAPLPPGNVIGVPHWGRRRVTRLPRLPRDVLRSLDLLVLHEGWTPSHYAAAFQARRAAVPYVVMPHGVYEPGIVTRLKPPRTLRQQAERRLLEHAAAVHVFFESEIPLVGAVAPNARYIVVPTPAPPPVGKTWTGGGGYLAWFGRYDPEHKGLDLLLEAMARIPRGRRPHLRLRGYDFKGGRERTERLAASLDVTDAVDFGGPVTGDEKDDFIARAQAYLHPSRWESYGISLLEVLGAGAPALVSRTIHLAPELVRRGAATCVEADPDAWAAALQQAATGQLDRTGPPAARFVKDELTAAVIGPRFDACLHRVLVG